MDLKHTVLLGGLALFGGFLGGRLGQPVTAQAQSPQVRSQNQVLVPNDGLRFVTEEGRTVAVMGLQAGNGVLVLLDAQGRPSVGMSAGVGGNITLRAQPDGAQIEMGSVDGSNRIRLSSTSAGSQLEAEAAKRIFSLLHSSSTTQLSMPGSEGKRGIELTTGQTSSSLALHNGGGVPAMSLEGAASGGLFSVRDATGKTVATVSNAGTFASHKDGRAVWQAPPTGG